MGEKKRNSQQRYSALYKALMGANISGLPILQQIKRIGQLVDVSGDLLQIEGINRAIELCTTLTKGSLLPEQKALLHYFCANAWSNKRHILRIPLDDWEQPALEQEIREIRLALSLSKGMPQERRYQLLTNLGNALSHTWRYVDAIHFFNSAIALVPQLGMAIANRALELRFYARLLWANHDRVVLIQAAYGDLQRALKLPLEGNARAHFEQAIQSLEKHVNPTVLRTSHNLEKEDLGKSKLEQRYRRWCLKQFLFLNPINDLGALPAGASDPLLLPGLTTPLNAGPNLIGFFNAMKQEFVSGRWLLFSAISEKKRHFSDKKVRLVNTLDYPTYSLSTEQGKTAFRIAYSLFDKIGYFLNDYLNLGIPQHEVTFRTVWLDRKTKKLRPQFATFALSPVRALFWLSRDLYEDGAGLTESLEPEARDLALTRNHLEHKYLKLHDDLWHGPRRKPDMLTALDDTLAFSVRRADFESQTIRLYQLVRSALIYLACTVHSHELRKKKGLQSERIMPMFLPDFDDEWKR
ncbi:MAG TPA: LA2681 family HEPN domain-containing protein [Terriglobales bacterium]|jgi:hypothetical protein|nr:LA2681 family HEPN domain-containing protein [Terriglobales bacterium]